MQEKTNITINNIDYIIYKFYYCDYTVSGKDSFFLLNDKQKKVKNALKGELYIRIPSWVDMQDLYQSSCRYNIMTKTYDLNEDLYRDYKISKICSKIITAHGDVIVMNNKVRDMLHPVFAQYILDRVEETIGIYYMGTGLTNEEEEKLSLDCYKYYSAIYKKYAGKDIIVPPTPSPIILMNVCKVFSCTPDVARKISKRDIDMTMIAKEQESICKNPSLIGLK